MAVLILSALWLMPTSGCDDKKGSGLQKGSPLPPLSLPDTEGNIINIPGDLSGSTKVLLFWRDGCTYCEREMPQIEPIYQKYHEMGLDFVAIHMGPGLEASKKLRDDMNLTFPLLIDKDSRTRKLYGVAAVPTMFVLDGKGLIRERILGGLGAGDIVKLIEIGTL